ncbi:hypothetical protein QFC22_006038 [Naganishia vaughanmartiniae]|uniref:Uncharacterized protein n=1 Tax=Naganishia vaughanmartiniae TaxID=1424756 RepID=A0ACC2WN82_9TREE|nr:hypothetical protein QFC22_006038 [Naganishia vaughanmartiniae]
MNLLSLPAETLDMVMDYLNAPEMPIMYSHQRPVSTACLCNVDKIIAQDNTAYPVWQGWKRDSLALGSVCKELRRSVFNRFWLEKAVVDWTAMELRRMGSVLDAAARAKVQTLTLRTDCNDFKPKPRLEDYVKFFPNLREIGITLIYPCLPGYEKPHKSKGAVGPYEQLPAHQSRSSFKTPVAGSSLRSVKLAIHGSSECRRLNYESQVNTWIQRFRSSDQLRQVGITQLDYYHLEIALGNDRDGEEFWDDLLRRLSLACSIPAKEVSICFGFKLRGEVDRFLKVLSLAMTNWPSEIEAISFCLSLADYSSGGHRDILDMVEKDDDGCIQLLDGYLPTKVDMDRLVKNVRMTRPHLRNFDLTMYVANPGRPVQRKLLDYQYTATVKAHLGRRMTGSLRFEVHQTALQALDQNHARVNEIDIFAPNDDAGSEASDDSEASEEADTFEAVMMRWKLMTMMKDMSAAVHLGFDESDDLKSWEEDELMFYRDTIFMEMMFIKCVESVMMVVREYESDSDADSNSDEED